MSPLEQFARAVLKILEAETDWNAGTVDDIAAEAFNRNLARNNEKTGLFEVNDQTP